MMKQGLLLFLLIAFSPFAFGQSIDFNYQVDFQTILEKTKDSLNDLHYDKLLDRFKTNDNSLSHYETLALMIGFTANENYKPYKYLSIEKAISKMNADGRHAEALERANEFLLEVPLSPQAIFEKSEALYKLNMKDSSIIYKLKYRKLMDAVVNSGSGVFPDKSFFVLGPEDAQGFVKNYLSGKIKYTGQAKDSHGNNLKVLGLVLKNENSDEELSQSLYFNIEHAVKTLEVEKKKKNTKKKARKENP